MCSAVAVMSNKDLEVRARRALPTEFPQEETDLDCLSYTVHEHRSSIAATSDIVSSQSGLWIC